MIAPDDTTFAYLEGRDHAPKGAAWEAALAEWRTLPTDDGAAFDKEVVLEAASLAPYVTWGTNPAQVTRIDGAVPEPSSFSNPADREAAARALEYMGLAGGDPDARHRGRHRVHRVVHQWSHRGPASRGRGTGGEEGHAGHPGPGGARLPPGQGPGRVRGAGRPLHRGRLRLAGARLLDVPGHEPRQAGSRRTGRVHVQSQLRGPPGPGGPHPPGLAGGGRGHRGGRSLRRTRGSD